MWTRVSNFQVQKREILLSALPRFENLKAALQTCWWAQKLKFDTIKTLTPLWLANETRKRRARSPKFAYLIHQKRSDCSHTIVHSKYTVQLHTQYIPSTQRKSLCIEWCRQSGRLDSSTVARKPSLKGLEWHSIIYIWCKNGPSGNIAAAPTNVLLCWAVGPGCDFGCRGCNCTPIFILAGIKSNPSLLKRLELLLAPSDFRTLLRPSKSRWLGGHSRMLDLPQCLLLALTKIPWNSATRNPQKRNFLSRLPYT